jgi:uncharacterized membrane protein YeaQ/YmgE (transglycosylase-associated protein family)
MGIILFLILGGISGWLASLVMKTDGEQGVLLNILVGCAGALIGGFVFNQVGEVGVTGFNLWSILVAFIGAVLLLAVVKLFRRA